MPQTTLNRSNWTGEEVTIEYTKDGRFNDVGEKFKLTVLEFFGENAVVELTGEGWEHPLESFYIEEYTMERAVRVAVRWVSNHI